MNKKIILSSFSLLLVVVALLGYKFLFLDRNKSEIDTRWEYSVESNTQVIDHSIWQEILDDYLVTDTDSGVNLFDYSGLLDDGRETLDQYIGVLSAIDPTKLNRGEQKPYWINLYNAATVELILDNYPLASITDIKGKIGSFGPWDNDAVVVNNIALSLNDIEHRIIRPLFNDYRIHFGVNCASIGCPDLYEQAFTSSNIEETLDEAASEYVNHSRGISFMGDTLQISSLFKWYALDFGENEKQVLKTLVKHAHPNINKSLTEFSGPTKYFYDWSLNGYCSIDNECGS